MCIVTLVGKFDVKICCLCACQVSSAKYYCSEAVMCMYFKSRLLIVRVGKQVNSWATGVFLLSHQSKFHAVYDIVNARCQ